MSELCPKCGAEFSHANKQFDFWVCGTWASTKVLRSPIEGLDCLRRRLATIEAENVREKQRRIYYQSIVYEVCQWLDIVLGRHNIGDVTSCGTSDSPSRGVQDAMALVQYKLNGIRDNLRRIEANVDKAAAAQAERKAHGETPLWRELDRLHHLMIRAETDAAIAARACPKEEEP